MSSSSSSMTRVRIADSKQPSRGNDPVSSAPRGLVAWWQYLEMLGRQGGKS